MMANNFASQHTIFLADDDPEDQEFLIQAFARITHDHLLQTAFSGRELIERLALIDDRELPCLIVLDYNMPGLDGKETLKYLKKSLRYKHIPTIIYSTSNSIFDKAELMLMGAREFITKATSIQGILQAAKKMLSCCVTRVPVQNV